MTLLGLARNECSWQFIYSLTQRQCRPRGWKKDLHRPLWVLWRGDNLVGVMSCQQEVFPKALLLLHRLASTNVNILMFFPWCVSSALVSSLFQSVISKTNGDSFVGLLYSTQTTAIRDTKLWANQWVSHWQFLRRVDCCLPCFLFGGPTVVGFFFFQTCVGRWSFKLLFC